MKGANPGAIRHNSRYAMHAPTLHPLLPAPAWALQKETGRGDSGGDPSLPSPPGKGQGQQPPDAGCSPLGVLVWPLCWQQKQQQAPCSSSLGLPQDPGSCLEPSSPWKPPSSVPRDSSNDH